MLHLLGIVLVMLLNPDVMAFVVALALATAAGNLYLIVRGWIELKRQPSNFRLRGHSRAGWRQEFPDLRKFVGILY